MISYKPLAETLKKKKKTINDLQDHLKNPRLRHTLNCGRYINLETIDSICSFLNCKVSDIILYEPGKQVLKDIPKKEYVNLNWERVKILCEEKRTSMTKMSVRMGKSAGYLSSMASKVHIGLSIAKEIARNFNVTLDSITYED